MNDTPTPTPTEIADALEAAADYIEVHGWTQGKMRNDDGNVCALGALCHHEGATFPSEVVDVLHGTLNSSVSGWNDESERVQSDVTDLFKHTAKAVRNGEIVP